MRSPVVGARLLGSALVVALLAACTPSAADPAPATPGSAAGSPGSVAAGDAPPGATSTSTPAAPTPVALATDRGRQGPGVVASGGDSPYNYGPTVVLDGGRHRMWWCGQLMAAAPAGDDILYAEAASADGPFAAPGGGPATPVLSGSVGGFDGMHTCDPSVIRVAGTYYLYYTGAAGDHAHGNAIGVATSTDGLTWTRAAGGAPILSPSYDRTRDNTYGAGQPSALWLDGWFHLMFTDTTGAAAGWNGAGQFVLRSKDPLFASGVQALGEGGFTPVAGTREPRTRSVVDAFSADLVYVDALRAFAIAHETEHGTTLTFWNREFTANPHPPVLVPGPWREGPGLVRTAIGHAPLAAGDPCGRIPFDLVRATALDPRSAAPTDLAHFGLDVADAPGCADEDAARVLDGFAVPSPENTVDLVTGGEVVRVERRSVADRLATRVLDRRPPAVDGMEVVARIPAGVRALRAPDGRIGLLLADARLWVIASAEVAALNSSPVTDVSQTAWDAHAKANDPKR
ncbi:beta-xylosidase [Saccharothrix longispora]|uniref:beta-xylosidase n=1 Tax=Saccharothrix longispora TaxID=33920 RepID=UPI0028FD3242|nr:beta-xylosidase [Saccharothrix longispora]MBY8848116.1 beta-xylosidase [Saccharothrix sp. MB29]MDU0288058.1 beta-xylosidase [Saccharothrix longispora]